MTGAIGGAVTGAIHAPYCFIARTAVLTAAGAVTIENIQPGDMVWAWNEETRETELKLVVETYVNETDKRFMCLWTTRKSSVRRPIPFTALSRAGQTQFTSVQVDL